jgi:trimeric autotransporter adhesin
MHCSFSPYKEHVPYITAAPEVCSRGLTAADRYLILATDGVWEQATSVEVAQWVGRSGTSEVIIREVLKRAALAHDLTVAALEALPLGTSRRSLHDDVCATVVQLAPLLAATAEAAQVAASAAAAAAAISAAAANTAAAGNDVVQEGSAADSSGMKDSNSSSSTSSGSITVGNSATEPAAVASVSTADAANHSSSAGVTMTDAPAVTSVSCSGELATQQAAAAAAATTATTRALITAGSGSL